MYPGAHGERPGHPLTTCVPAPLEGTAMRGLKLVRSFLTRRLASMSTFAADLLVGVRERSGGRRPLVALLSHLPRLWPATFETHVTARIGGTAEADLIPRIGVGIVCFYRILYHQHPIAPH